MKKRAFYNLIKLNITVIFIMAVLIMPHKAYASSADISFSSETTEAAVGDIVTVYLNIKADVFPGNFEGYIAYDSDILEYREGPECITGSEGILKVSDMVLDSSLNTRRYIMSFEAVGRGECEFSMLGVPELYEFEAGYLMSVAASPLTIDVRAGSDASGETGLADLKLSPGKLVPDFDENVTEYTTTVDENTDKLIVSAHAKDLSADVEIVGNDFLAAGSNRITITVTAESGEQREYVIYCEKKSDGAAQEPEASPAPEEPERDEAVAIKDVDGRTYIYGKYEYYVCDIPDDFIVPEGYTATALVLDGQSVTAYVREDKPDDDFLLLILKHGGSEPNLYCYDRVEKTIQRYESGSLTNKITVQQAEPSKAPEQTPETGDSGKLTGLVLAIVVLCAVCALLLVLVIRLFMKNKGINRDDLDN